MVETVVILFVALLLLLGILQFALIYDAKNTLNYATFEAARAGAVNHADRQAVEYALARGLAPLYTSLAPGAGRRAHVTAVQAARDRVLAEFRQGGKVCIERINPTPEAFRAYGIRDPLGRFKGRILPNDHLRFRSARNLRSRVNIQDANLLKLRVTYCYPMYAPFISQVIQRLMGTRRDPDPPRDWQTPRLGTFRRACYAEGRFPIVAQALVRMQSPAWEDPDYDTDCR